MRLQEDKMARRRRQMGQFYHKDIPINLDTLTDEELKRAGFILIKHLGWVHRSHMPPKAVIMAFSRLSTRNVKDARNWARIFIDEANIISEDQRHKTGFIARLALGIRDRFLGFFKLFSSSPRSQPNDQQSHWQAKTSEEIVKMNNIQTCGQHITRPDS